MLFDVGFDRNEILLDEVGGFLIFVRLGIQPSTRPSGRSCAEIQQDGPVLLLRFIQCCINILRPIHSHAASQ